MLLRVVYVIDCRVLVCDFVLLLSCWLLVFGCWSSFLCVCCFLLSVVCCVLRFVCCLLRFVVCLFLFRCFFDRCWSLVVRVGCLLRVVRYFVIVVCRVFFCFVCVACWFCGLLDVLGCFVVVCCLHVVISFVNRCLSFVHGCVFFCWRLLVIWCLLSNVVALCLSVVAYKLLSSIVFSLPTI